MACCIDLAIVESTRGGFLSEYSWVQPSHLIWCISMVAKHVPLKASFRVGNNKNHSERDPECTVFGRWQECLPRWGISAQVMCGPVRYRDAETTLPTTCRATSPKVHRATCSKFARRNDQKHYVQAVRSQGAPNRQRQKNSGEFFTALIS
jgi:hypothetical protein